MAPRLVILAHGECSVADRVGPSPAVREASAAAGLPHCAGPRSTSTHSHPWSPKATPGFVDVGRPRRLLRPDLEMVPGAQTSQQRSWRAKTRDGRAPRIPGTHRGFLAGAG